MRFVKLNEYAVTPKKTSIGAAGFDLASCEDKVIIPAHGKALISTGLKFEIPIGTYGQIASRSGLALNHFVITIAGVIDSGLFY